jgi:N-acetylglucosamine malate deacetylase 1
MVNEPSPFLPFIEGIRNGLREAQGISVEKSKAQHATGPAVLLFSPHPDDECIIGLLPLRLMRECGYRVINIPVTFGSDRSRRPARKLELEAACDWLGWEVQCGNSSLDPLASSEIAYVLAQTRPAAIFLPHDKDWNSTHLEVHRRVMEALGSMDDGFSCRVIETEFWGAMDDPNLIVEADSVLLADLVAATSLHTGEVARNPYHLHLPAWMQDNVRRGAERIGGQGGTAPAFDFATLYRARSWHNGRLASFLTQGTLLPIGESPAQLL